MYKILLPIKAREKQTLYNKLCKVVECRQVTNGIIFNTKENPLEFMGQVKPFLKKQVYNAIYYDTRNWKSILGCGRIEHSKVLGKFILRGSFFEELSRQIIHDYILKSCYGYVRSKK